MNVNDLLVKSQIYQERYIIHHPHFDPDIKNTITIFHHSWQAFESTDKPWLRYYFRPDKQSNIFYSSEFHLICRDFLHCILVALKEPQSLSKLSVQFNHVS